MTSRNTKLPYSTEAIDRARRVFPLSEETKWQQGRLWCRSDREVEEIDTMLAEAFGGIEENGEEVDGLTDREWAALIKEAVDLAEETLAEQGL